MINNTATKFLNEHDLAGQLGLSVKTLRAWRMFAHGPKFRRFGRGPKGSVRYSQADVDEWVNQRPCGGEQIRAAR